MIKRTLYNLSTQQRKKYMRHHITYNREGGTDIQYGEVLVSYYFLKRYLLASPTFYIPPSEREKNVESIYEPDMPEGEDELFQVETYTCSNCHKEKHMNAFARDEHFRVASYCLSCKQDVDDKKRQRWLYILLGATAEQADIIMEKNVSSVHHALYISLYMLFEACNRLIAYSEYKTVFELRNIYLPQVLDKLSTYGYSDHLFVDEYRFWMLLGLLHSYQQIFVDKHHSTVHRERDAFMHPDLGVSLDISFTPIRGIVAIP